MYFVVFFSADRLDSRTLVLSEEGTLFGDLYTREEWVNVNPDCLNDFIYFLDHYATKVYGPRSVETYLRTHRDKSVLDRFTVSDLAYGVLVYENTVALWENKIVRRESRESLGENEVRVVQKYHRNEGARLRTFECGWTEEGVKYMKELVEKFRLLWGDSVFMKKLLSEWDAYAKKEGKYQYRQRKSLSRNLELDNLLDNDDDDQEVFMPFGPIETEAAILPVDVAQENNSGSEGIQGED